LAGGLDRADLNAVKVFTIGFLARASEMLAEQGIPWLTLMRDITPCYSDLLNKQSIKDVDLEFCQLVSLLCELTESHQRQKIGEAVSKAIQNIQENYSDPDLSLSAMSRKLSFNSSYLSRAFKEFTGKTFSEYLIEMRINTARAILERSDCKAYQLAQLVGIPDPNYFTKCFKKVIGVSFQSYCRSMDRNKM
jgi:two-component system response regulator YesN